MSKATLRCSFALAPLHDRGRVLADVAVMLADGGESIADIDVLGHQGSVLGPVASTPTVWRTLDEVRPGWPLAVSGGIDRGRTLLAGPVPPLDAFVRERSPS